MNKTWTAALMIGLFAVSTTWAEEAATKTDAPQAKAAETKPAEAKKNAELEAIQQACMKLWNKRKSVTANLASEMNTTGPGFTMSGTGTGTMKMLRKDGVTMSRMVLSQKMTHKMGDQEQTIEQDIETVSDGKVSHVLTKGMGMQQCIKMDPENAMDFSPMHMFKSLQEQFDLAVKPEEKFNEAEVYVIEGTPKASAQANPMIQKMRLLISKEHGIMLQQQFLGPDGKPINTFTITDVKLDVPMDAAVFDFKVPEGVQVIDQTGA